MTPDPIRVSIRARSGQLLQEGTFGIFHAELDQEDRLNLLGDTDDGRRVSITLSRSAIGELPWYIEPVAPESIPARARRSLESVIDSHQLP